MTDRDTVRMLIADPVNYDRATALGDGVTTVFQLPNFPAVAGTAQATVNAVGAAGTLDSETGRFTFAVAPAAGAVVLITYGWVLLSDETLDALIVLEGGLKLAAAQALEIIATSEVLIQKRIEILDLKTDGPAMMDALLKRSAQLRADAAAGVGGTADDFAGAFDVAEHGWDAETRWALRGRAWVEQSG